MADLLDLRLEALLRSTLKAEAASVPLAIGPADVLRRRDLRRRERARLRIRLLVIAAVVALPLGAVLVGARSLDPLRDGYTAVLMRGTGDSELEVFAARDGVAEHLLSVPMSRLADAGIRDATGVRILETSATGWIAMSAATEHEQPSGDRERVVLLNARDPDAAPVVRPGTHLGAWTPDGRYWSATNAGYELIDPASGQVMALPRDAGGSYDWFSSGNGRMQLATEGHGLLLRDGDGRWGVLAADGSVSAGLPQLAEGAGPRGVSSRWGLLQPRPEGARSGPAPDGSNREWGAAPPLHHFLLDASWAVDGGLWLLIDRRSDRRTMVLVHRDEDDVDREVAAFPVDIDARVAIRDLAPDDSLIALGLIDPAGAWQTVVVDTRSGSSHLFSGEPGGFVPTASTVDWVTGDRSTETGQLLPRPAGGGGSGPAYAPLPSLEQQTASLFGDRNLLVHEARATSVDPGPRSQMTLGPVELKEGVGISLVCSGPGRITLTEISADGLRGLPEPYDCFSTDAQWGYGHEGPFVRGSIAVLVEFDPSTAWRLIIYDPPPSSGRP